ncbi:hypothetical protein BRETT_000468 [Brettanomyces bruxellensis]|uniref:Uncharacterized protein n=1 Tax=Dekkera bruxellensis TaxID=5007 RepID=A0A871R9B5_DEKBR|nr:uncharacterized protein BRETT_000468 [Brettanomyces bruxellensis]QOU20755.1 hypothetical protein BRETT_000468 [Brettanomyces bruxellensis]
MIGASSISEMFRQYAARLMSVTKQPVSRVRPAEGTSVATMSAEQRQMSDKKMANDLDRIIEAEMLLAYD